MALLARTGFPLEVARWMVESSEAPGFILPRYQWRTEVRLAHRLGDRALVDRGPAVAGDEGEGPSRRALTRLEAELAAARTPALRRRLRTEIKAIRRNPWRARGPLS